MRPGRLRGGRAWWFAGLKIAVSAGLLLLLAANLDLAAVRSSLARLPASALAGAVILLLLQTCVLGLRWRLVLTALGTRPGAAGLIAMTFVGAFFNQVLPSSVGGDGVRMWQAYRGGMAKGAAINGVLLERISGVLGLLVMSAAGVLYLGERLESPALRLALLAALPLGALGIGLLAALDGLLGPWRGHRLLRGVASLGADARAVLCAPHPALALLLLSVVSHGLAALATFVLAAGLGLALGPWDCLALVPAVLLVTLAPVSLAGWGLREGAMVAILGAAGVAAGAALALSLAFGLALALAALPGCGFWLVWRQTGRARGAAA